MSPNFPAKKGHYLVGGTLGEATTTKLHKDRNSLGFKKLHNDAKDGGAVAGRTRKDIEDQTKKKVISSENYLDKTGRTMIED